MLGTPTGVAEWFDRLPHGRHGLARESVLASQRGRMLEGIAVAVSAKGYGATTIADVTAAAKVSRRTFYEQFADKEDCFLAAFDTGIGYLLSEMSNAARGAGDWQDRLRAGVKTMLSVLADDPAFTRIGTVEIVSAGPAALERRAEMMRVFARQYQRLHDLARKTDPSIEKRDARVFAALAGGVIELVVIHVVDGRTTELPQLQPVVMQFLVAGLTGPVSAAPTGTPR